MLNFNVKPYYDDFDETKNYHRILFKPGYAVQARELTQSQTILQNQVTKFADHIFVQNSPVSGGKMSVNFKCYYVKLQDSYNGVAIDVNDFQNLLVKNSNGSVLARVIAVASATGGDPPTLILSYLSGPKFADNDVIYDVTSNLAAQALTTASTGLSSAAHITQGVFYVLGNFVTNVEETVILSKYSDVPSVRVGLNITETIHDYVDDSSLLDPAIGATNYQAPGADRYVIDLNLETRPLTFGDDQTFIELLRIENGQIVKKVDGSIYSTIDDYFAKRTYDTNGDYIVNDFSLTPKTNDDPTIYTMNIGKGVAYVHGYRLENQTPISITSDRARTTASQNNVPVFMDYGNYLYINALRGANGSIFDVSTSQTIDLHCVTAANINTTNTATYSSTVVASGYIRGLNFDHYTSQSDANTYVYKAYVNDLQNAVLTANAIAGGTNTITLPGTYSTTSNAYLGVNISITAGPSAGDFRTIASYNGATRIATVNQAWTATPTTASVFALNFGVKDAEVMVSSNAAHYILSTSVLSADGREGGLSTGDPSVQNPNVPEMLFRVGMPYVATLADTSYTTTQMFRGITFTPSGGNLVAQLPFGGDYSNVMRHLGTGGTTLSADVVSQNFHVIVTSKGSSNYNVGDQLPWTINSRTVTLNSDGSIATLTGTSADLGGTFTATVIVKAFVSNAENTGHILKRKNLITANTQKVISSSNTAVGNGTYTYVDDSALTSTGQVYIQNAGLVSPGSKQSLYMTDVKKIIKIIDTGNANTAPNVAMLTSSTYDVTQNFIFDDGQRDNYYDHASVKLKIGAPKIKGNMLVLMDYYQHTGGDGYFSVESYLNSSLPESYREIGSYTSTSGATYQLKDSLDFRPTRQNGVYSFAFRYSNSGDTQRYGTLLPVDLSTFTTDYQYYLARKDKLVLSKDRSFQIVQGAPAVNPIFPPEPDNSLLIANITHQPYTGYLPIEAPVGVKPDISIEKVKHKRYTMQDIASIENRIGNLEYYTSLNLLEQQTQSLQITDAYGLNRFKNGIVVDNFSGFLTADTASDDFLASINRRERKMQPLHLVKNFPLKSLDVVTTFGGQFSSNTSLGYSVDKDGFNTLFSLPYTTANVATQKVASRSFNLNPFNVANRKGTASTTPNTNTKPPVTILPVVPNNPGVIIQPNVGQDCHDEVYWQEDLDLGGYGTGHGGGQWVTHTVCIPKTSVTAGDWKTVSTGTQTTNNVNNTSYDWKNTSGQYGGVTSNVDNVVDNTFTNNNDFIFDNLSTSLIDAQQTSIAGSGLLINTPVTPTFQGDDITPYFKPSTVVTVTDISDNFNVGDVIGTYVGPTFKPIGKIVATETLDDATNLHIEGDINNADLYSAGATLVSVGCSVPTPGNEDNPVTPTEIVCSATLDTVVITSGTFSTDHTSTSTVQLSSLADSIVDYIGDSTNPATLNVVAGTGAGQSVEIVAWDSGTNTATLSGTITASAGDVYSTGPFVTSPTGLICGTFCIPADTFTGGTIRIDDATTIGDITTATTAADTTFYSSSDLVAVSQIPQDPSPAPSGSSDLLVTSVDPQNSTIGSVDMAGRININSDGSVGDGGGGAFGFDSLA